MIRYKWALSPVKAVLGQMQRDAELRSISQSHAGAGDLEALSHSTGLESAAAAGMGMGMGMGMGGSVSNADAERAILKVKEKLEGLENGDRRSVQGQVQQLLRQAQDVDKLSVMYCGWGPWL